MQVANPKEQPIDDLGYQLDKANAFALGRQELCVNIWTRLV